MNLSERLRLARVARSQREIQAQAATPIVKTAGRGLDFGDQEVLRTVLWHLKTLNYLLELDAFVLDLELQIDRAKR